MDDRRWGLPLALGALLGLCALAFFSQLGGLGLLDKTEGLFVEVPRQMLLSGDWITPRWNGEPFFDYPVWGYWMVALSFRLFGVSVWAARLPVALAASATVFALFALVLLLAPADEPQQRRLGRALLCATVLCLSPGWIGWGRTSVTDMFLASAIGLALIGFALAHGATDRPWLRRLGRACLALFTAVAVLAKGPVGLLLPLVVIGLFLLLKGRPLRPLPLGAWLPMAGLLLAVVLPWYALVTAANGSSFLVRFLGTSNLQRFTAVIYNHPGPPWFYLPWLLLLLLPWSVYLPLALARLRFWRLSRWRRPQPPGSDLALLAALWLLVVVVFFSAAATKLPGYILPALPAAALLVGLLFVPLPGPGPAPADRGAGWGWRCSGWCNALLLALGALAAASAPRWLPQDPAAPGFVGGLAASGAGWCLALPLLAASLLLVRLLRRGDATALGHVWWPNAAGLALALALLLPVLVPLIDRERLLPTRQLAGQAARLARPREPLLVAGYRRYSVVFYARRPVQFVGSAREAWQRLRAAAAAPPASVLLLGSDSDLLEFGIGPGDGQPLQRLDAHRLLRLPWRELQRLAQG